MRWRYGVVTAALLAAGCSSTNAGNSGASAPGSGISGAPTGVFYGGSSSGSAGGPTVGPGAPPTRVSVAESAFGRTVAVSVGSVVVVTLHSTYWRFGAPHPAGVLTASSPTVTVATTGPRVPGSGRGTITATFRAQARGTATVAATRTTCGEALRCVGRQGEYRITVVVG